MCSPKFCSFLHILSTILCTLFHTHTVLAIRVYCNAQNIIHFYAFLIQMTAFGFARISCSRVDLILCSLPIFCRESSVICVFSKKIVLSWFSNFKTAMHRYWNCAYGSILYSPEFSSLFHTKWIKCTKPYETYVQSLTFWEKFCKATNHPYSHGSPNRTQKNKESASSTVARPIGRRGLGVRGKLLQGVAAMFLW